MVRLEVEKVMEKVVDSGEIAAGGGTSVQLTWYSSNLIMLRGLKNMHTHSPEDILRNISVTNDKYQVTTTE